MGPLAAVTQVELIGGDRFGLRDLVVPLLTLIGGLAGVLIAGAINRRTLERLEARRDVRDAERDAERHRGEMARDAERHRREMVAERRRAFGAGRAIFRELSNRALLIERLDGHFAEAPLGSRFTIEMTGDDATLLAAWLLDETWASLSEALAYLQHLEWDHLAEEPGVGSTYGDAHGAVVDALSALERDADERLRAGAALPQMG